MFSISLVTTRRVVFQRSHATKTLSTVSASSSSFGNLSHPKQGHHQPHHQPHHHHRAGATSNNYLSLKSIRRQSSNSSSSSSSSSSNSKNNKNRRFQLDALPFSISPEQALEKFQEWAQVDQGLRYLLSYNSIRIGAAYVPVWSFDLNIRFGKGDWKPPMFRVYDNGNTGGNTIHLPGLSAYAGYSYRRSLVQPVHSTSLVFLGDQTEPFGGWMLRDMVLQSTQNTITINPDAWNATQGRALNVVKEELQSIVDASWSQEDHKGGERSPPPNVQTQVVKSRRVFMPTFVIEYKILGLEYKAFVSGCDRAAAVSGNSHQVFGDMNLFDSPEFSQSSRNFLSNVLFRAQTLPFLLRLLRPAATFIWFFVLRLWAAVPIVGLAGGFLTGYRKIYQPWMDARLASADWERQREHESLMDEEDDDSEDSSIKADFYDTSGVAQRHFVRNKSQILNFLSGDYEHEQGGYDWYKDWQDWAQQQWQQQQQQQQTSEQQQTYQQQQQSQQQTYQKQQRGQQQKKSKAKETYHWDFDEKDPYSVLGIQRGVTKQQVSQAFRTQMLKHHPDTQPNASEAQKRRLVERSKFITEAYRKIKGDMKR